MSGLTWLSRGLSVAMIFGLILGVGCRPRTASSMPSESAGSSGGAGTSRRAPARSRATAQVADVRLGDSDAPVVVAQMRWGLTELTLVSAPSVSTDYVSTLLTRRTGLRGCAEMQLRFGSSYASAELESFDRQGLQVRYELPFSGVVRAAAASSATFQACGQELELDVHQMAELRRMALLAIYRRAQAAPAMALPTLATGPIAEPPSEEEAHVSGSLQLDPFVSLTLEYDGERQNQVRMAIETRHRAGFPEDCEVSLEAGPAAISATLRDVSESRQRMAWSIDDIRGFFALGVTDHAQLNYCSFRFDLSRVASGLRRFVLVTLLRRAELLGAAPDLDLPPGERREDSGLALPRRRESGSGDVVAPSDAPVTPPEDEAPPTTGAI